MKRIFCLFLTCVVSVTCFFSACYVPVYGATSSGGGSHSSGTWDDYVDSDGNFLDTFADLTATEKMEVVIGCVANAGDLLETIYTNSGSYSELFDNLASQALSYAGISTTMNSGGGSHSGGLISSLSGHVSADDDGNVTYDADGLNAIRDYVASQLGYVVYPAIPTSESYLAANYITNTGFIETSFFNVVSAYGDCGFAIFSANKSDGRYVVGYSGNSIDISSTSYSDVPMADIRDPYLYFYRADNGIYEASLLGYAYRTSSGSSLTTSCSFSGYGSNGYACGMDSFVGFTGNSVIVYNTYDDMINAVGVYEGTSTSTYYMTSEPVESDYTTTIQGIVDGDAQAENEEIYNYITNVITNVISADGAISAVDFQAEVDDGFENYDNDSGDTSDSDDLELIEQIKAKIAVLASATATIDVTATDAALQAWEYIASYICLASGMYAPTDDSDFVSALVAKIVSGNKSGSWSGTGGLFSIAVDDSGNITIDSGDLVLLRKSYESDLGYTLFPALVTDYDTYVANYSIASSSSVSLKIFFNSTLASGVFINPKVFIAPVTSTSSSDADFVCDSNCYKYLNIDDMGLYGEYTGSGTYDSLPCDYYKMYYAYYDSGFVNGSSFYYMYFSDVSTKVASAYRTFVNDSYDAAFLGFAGHTVKFFDSYSLWQSHWKMLNGYTTYSAPDVYLSNYYAEDGLSMTVDTLVSDSLATAVSNCYSSVTSSVTSMISSDSSIEDWEYQSVIDKSVRSELVAYGVSVDDTVVCQHTLDSDNDDSSSSDNSGSSSSSDSWHEKIYNKLCDIADNLATYWSDIHNRIVNMSSAVTTAITDFMETYNTAVSQGNSYLADIKKNTATEIGTVSGDTTTLTEIKALLQDILSALGGSDSSGDSDSSATEEEGDDDGTQIGLLRKIKNLLGLIVIGQGVDTATDLLEYGTDELEDWKDNLTSAVSEVGDAMQDVFPFCIPWALIAVVSAFVADAEAPQFDLPIKFDRLGIDYTIHVDLTDFESVSVICRTLLGVIWVVGLMRWTVRLTHGEGGDSE